MQGRFSSRSQAGQGYPSDWLAFKACMQFHRSVQTAGTFMEAYLFLTVHPSNKFRVYEKLQTIQSNSFNNKYAFL